MRIKNKTPSVLKKDKKSHKHPWKVALIKRVFLLTCSSLYQQGCRKGPSNKKASKVCFSLSTYLSVWDLLVEFPEKDCILSGHVTTI
jgi:hypothetical protein